MRPATGFLAGCLAVAAIGAAAAAPPREKRITLRVEGEEQTLVLRRFDAPRYAFTTYYPKDMEVETVASGEGDAVRFMAAFDGKKNPEAVLHIFVAPAGMKPARARQLARAAVLGRGFKNPRPVRSPHRWASEEWSLERKGHLGYVARGQAGSRLFHVILDYPADYADGMAPRVERVLSELRWRATGRGL